MLTLNQMFFFIAPAPTEIYTLSLHDALPICVADRPVDVEPERAEALLDLGLLVGRRVRVHDDHHVCTGSRPSTVARDRKSTRLNSSHRCISYAVFCLKKKNKPLKYTVIRTST